VTRTGLVKKLRGAYREQLAPSSKQSDDRPIMQQFLREVKIGQAQPVRASQAPPQIQDIKSSKAVLNTSRVLHVVQEFSLVAPVNLSLISALRRFSLSFWPTARLTYLSCTERDKGVAATFDAFSWTSCKRLHVTQHTTPRRSALRRCLLLLQFLHTRQALDISF
jgi:hypothetical protein